MGECVEESGAPGEIHRLCSCSSRCHVGVTVLACHCSGPRAHRLPHRSLGSGLGPVGGTVLRDHLLRKRACRGSADSRGHSAGWCTARIPKVLQPRVFPWVGGGRGCSAQPIQPPHCRPVGLSQILPKKHLASGAEMAVGHPSLRRGVGEEQGHRLSWPSIKTSLRWDL